MPKRKMPKPDPESKYSTLPPPIDLSKTVASVDTSIAQVEQSDATDWNQGADPYLRVVGWKRP
ncbi:Uncharacterised protein [Mycobacteroides abscessus subsp. abscessus]|uniref:hypothetical protein n=1 Tax=Mycobacteroides abscessus TaxID=36809 RepID=UPI0009299CC9|nr:hypothetical protein [Mycobacteroides abscessus]SHU68340.1 Uncharacterised protein [Mycobacteroides abscessus subsp. abscessus]